MKAFAAALLIFGIVYVVWRTIVWDKQRKENKKEN